MKVYVLTITGVDDEDIEVSTDLFLSREAAQADIQSRVDKIREDNQEGIEKGWLHCDIGDDRTVVHRQSSTTTMEISEKELPVEMIIHLHGGLVQSVYSTADIRPEVYDTDSDDADLQGEIEGMRKRLDEIEADPNWIEVR